MDHLKEHIQYLWEQYISEKASKEELKELFSYIKNPQNDSDNQLISQKIVESIPSFLSVSQPEDFDEVWEGIIASRYRELPPPTEEWSSDRQPNAEEQLMSSEPFTVPRVHRIHFLRRAWFRYAAAIILLTGTIVGIVVSSDRQYKSETDLSKITTNDVKPGSYKATLTLADGSTVVLDTATQGELVQQGNTIVLNKDGKLVYEASKVSNEIGKEVAYNTLSTARGQIYSIVLPDGSHVWLNSQSSIRYPVAFTGKERKVEITGEAYFEVEKDAVRPFKVNARDMDLQVLGTMFNVNGYNDEDNIKVTLIEGSIRLTTGKNKALLKPGQQAQVELNKISVNTDVDVDKAIAWKNGQFFFNKADFKTVMRQLARWYDVEVVYQRNVPKLIVF